MGRDDSPWGPLGRQRAPLQVRWGDSATLALDPAITVAGSGELVSTPVLPTLAPRVWLLSAVATTEEEPAPRWSPADSWLEVWSGTGSALATWQIQLVWPAVSLRPTPPPLALRESIAASQLRVRVRVADPAPPGPWRGTVSLWASPWVPLSDGEVQL